MDRYDMLTQIAEAQNQMMDVVTRLSSVERELLGEREKAIELTDFDLMQLEDGFTITVIHEGRALRLKMRGE